ncbi:hypothetical protein GCM10027269_24040 [Kribbella endophytica]
MIRTSSCERSHFLTVKVSSVRVVTVDCGVDDRRSAIWAAYRVSSDESKDGSCFVMTPPPEDVIGWTDDGAPVTE